MVVLRIWFYHVPSLIIQTEVIHIWNWTNHWHDYHHHLPIYPRMLLDKVPQYPILGWLNPCCHHKLVHFYKSMFKFIMSYFAMENTPLSGFSGKFPIVFPVENGRGPLPCQITRGQVLVRPYHSLQYRQYWPQKWTNPMWEIDTPIPLCKNKTR